MEAEKIQNIILEKIECFQDFPITGVSFKDIFSVLREPDTFKLLIIALKQKILEKSPNFDVIVALDARGFIMGSILAYELSKPFVPIRKKGKLPGDTEKITYKLEYGEECMEVQKNSIKPGDKVVIVDDLLATGGTMKVACDLIDTLKGKVSLCLVCIELTKLEARKKINYPVESIVFFHD